jgi:uncharacterized protein YicC (UPF0701 family)
MKFRLLSLTLLLAISGAFYSCSDGSDADRAADEIANGAENVLANMGAELRTESDEFANEFKQARMKVDKRMAVVKADMENASEEAKADMQEELNQLEAYGNDIDSRMDRVGDNMASGWKDFKGDVKDGWKDFTGESKKLLNKIERDLDSDGDLD